MRWAGSMRATVAAAVIVAVTADVPPMNQVKPYTLANTNSTPTFRGEYFEMYGSVQNSRYADVDWHPDPVPLPQDIIDRFDGKVMAITGLEVNIVRQTANGDEDVLTTEQYNHHYSGYMYGKTMVEADAPFGRVRLGTHGQRMPHFVERLPAGTSACDIAGLWFNPENGIYVNITATSTAGTYSAACVGPVGWKSATIVVTSPTSGQPQGSATLSVPSDGSKKTPGVFSTCTAAGAPTCTQVAWADDNTWAKMPWAKSGSSGIPKVQAFSEGNGNEHRLSYKGFANEFAILIESPVRFSNNPMIINTNKHLTNDTSPGPVGGPLPRNSLAPPNADYSGILECPCTSRLPKVLDAYMLGNMPRCGLTITTLAECQAAIKTLGVVATVGNESIASAPYGCTAAVSVSGRWTATFNADASATAECASNGGEGAMAGAATVGGVAVALQLDSANRSVVATLAAAAGGNWFGVGFNTSLMNGAYAVVVDGKGTVTEHSLGLHAPGTLLPPTVTVLSNSVVGGTRTVVLRMAVGAAHAPMWSAVLPGEFPVIAAVGSTPTFSYHKSHATGTVVLGAVGQASCVCRDPSVNQGTIAGTRFNPKVCAPYPTSELLNTTYGGQINPICNISAYDGGLICCHGGVVLLDATQEQPKPVDTWRMKYRFYFEEYTSQMNTFRVWWSTEATNNEYTVPKSEYDCLDPSTPPEKCTHIMHSQFTARDMVASPSACMVSGDSSACGDVGKIENEYGGYFRLTYAAFHCHAPACMLGELWNRDTGKLICRNTPVYGEGLKAMDEKGYIVAIPPCVWGSAEEGLPPPPVLHLDDNLTSVKHCNSTNGHWGVMALWQMRAAYMSANASSP